MNNYLKEIIKFFAVLLFEVKLLFLLEIAEIKPSLFLIFLILYTIKTGNPIIGATLGFISGLFLDFFNTDYLGLSSLSFSLVGFISGYFGQLNEKLTKTRIFGFSLLMILIHTVTYNVIKGFTLDSYHLFMMIIAPTICYTSILQIVITYFLPYNKKKREL